DLLRAAHGLPERQEVHLRRSGLGQARRADRSRAGRDARGLPRGPPGPLQPQQPRRPGGESRSGAGRRLQQPAPERRARDQVGGYLIDWIDWNGAPSIPDGAEDTVYMGLTPAYRTANRYITSTSELLALPGFGRDRYLALAPYVTALPADGSVRVNICTAPGKVLDAYLGHPDFGSDP